MYSCHKHGINIIGNNLHTMRQSKHKWDKEHNVGCLCNFDGTSKLNYDNAYWWRNLYYACI